MQEVQRIHDEHAVSKRLKCKRCIEFMKNRKCNRMMKCRKCSELMKNMKCINMMMFRKLVQRVHEEHEMW
jgi:hypothetical protein